MPAHAETSTAGPPHFRGVFRDDPLARSLYAEAAGIAQVLPHAVAVPADADDLVALLQWARSEGFTLIPRGSGSSMSGGAIGSGVMVDLSRMTAIAPVDTDQRSIRVEPGALRVQVDAAARAVGLTFPVDPSSGAFCTVGGMIATNAAGARTLRHGATRAWVRGLRCLFDDGSVAWIRRDAPLPLSVPAVARLAALLDGWRGIDMPTGLRHPGVRKESSGYAVADALAAGGHLLDLLVGSEGTLGMFVEAELALKDVPAATATVLVSFPSLEHASACAVHASAEGASACELLDRTFLDIVAERGETGVSSTADAVLIMEVEGESVAHASDAARALGDWCRTHGAIEVQVAADVSSERQLWALRHAASPILSQLAPRLQSMQFIEDGCVPPARLAEYVRGVRAALDRFDTRGVIFGHAGDAHVHVNPLVDIHRAHWKSRVQGILDDVTDLTARLGGTLAGEHGDGRLRAPLLSRVWSASALKTFAAVKRAGDPAGLFNAGCKVATSGAEPVGRIKYDPEADALDPRARAMLDSIARERAWHRFRLA